MCGWTSEATARVVKQPVKGFTGATNSALERAADLEREDEEGRNGHADEDVDEDVDEDGEGVDADADEDADEEGVDEGVDADADVDMDVDVDTDVDG